MNYVAFVFAIFLAFGSGSFARSGVQKFTYNGILGKDLPIEVTVPEGHSSSGKAPALLFFHGGSWVGGSINQGKPFCEYFSKRGMVTINTTYSRHSKEGVEKLPKGESLKKVCVIDGKRAIRWVKRNAEKFGIDPDRIVVFGASAGGHIGILSMLNEEFNHPDDDTTISTDVAGFVMLCAAFTQLDLDKTPGVNVFKHLNKKKIPPVLFLVGEKDRWKVASEKFRQELKKRDVEVEAWMGRDVGHMFFREKDWLAPSLQMIDKFLMKYEFVDPLKLPVPTGKELVELK